MRRTRRLRDRMVAVLAAAGVVMTAAGLVVLATGGTAQAGNEGQVVVCKYVSTPGGGERFSHVTTPNANSLPGFEGTFPYSFSDGQGSSIAIGYVGQVGETDCPGYEPPAIDVCENLPGDQAEVPEGYTEADGVCTEVPPVVTDVCENLPGDQAEVPEGYTEADGVCTEVPPVVTDVCENLPGDQAEVPEGYTRVGGSCVKDEVAPTDTSKPRPEPVEEPVDEAVDEPVVAPGQVPAEVLASSQAVPTAVDAGLLGPTSPAGGSTGAVLGQGLVGAGLLMLVLAGSLQRGRRTRGAHEV